MLEDKQLLDKLVHERLIEKLFRLLYKKYDNDKDFLETIHKFVINNEADSKRNFLWRISFQEIPMMINIHGINFKEYYEDVKWLADRRGYTDDIKLYMIECIDYLRDNYEEDN